MTERILDIVFWLLPPVLLVLGSFKIFKLSGKEPFIAHSLLSIILISLGLSGKLFIFSQFNYPIFKYTFLLITLVGSVSLYPTVKIVGKILNINVDFKKIFLVILPTIFIASVLLGYYFFGLSSIPFFIIEGVSISFITLPIILLFYVERKYLHRKSFLILTLYISYFVYVFGKDFSFLYFLIPLLFIALLIHYLTDKRLYRKIKEHFFFSDRGSVERRIKILKLIFISSLIVSIVAILGNLYISRLIKSVRDEDIRDSQRLIGSYENHFISNFNLLMGDLKDNVSNCRTASFEEFKIIYKDDREIVNSIMFYDENGNLLRYFPSMDLKNIKERISEDILNRVKNGEVFYSSPHKNIYDSYSIVMYYPLFKRGETLGKREFLGVIAVSMDFNNLINDFIKNAFLDKDTLVVISGKKEQILWSSNKSLILKPLFFLKSNKFLFINKVLDKEMSLNVGIYKEKKAVLKNTDLIITHSVLSFIVLIVGVVFAGYFFIRGEYGYSKEIEKELEFRFKELINYRNSLYLLNQKLERIIKTITNINPRKGLFDILRRFMSLAKSVIRDVDAGILFIKRKGFFEPTFSFGLSKRNIRKIVFPLESLYLIDFKNTDTYKGNILELFSTLGVSEEGLSFEKRESLKEFREAIILKGSVEREVVCLCFLLSKKKGFLDEENLSISTFISKTMSSFIELKHYLFLVETDERRVKALVEILTSFSFDKRISDILKDAFEILSRVFEGRVLSVGYGTPGRDNVDITVVFNDEVRMFTLPKNIGIMGRSLRTKRVEIVSDVSKDPDYYEISDRVKSEIFIPIYVKNDFLGVVELSFDKKGLVGERDRPFFEEVGRIIGLSINNLNLFNRLKESYLETVIALVKTIELKDPYTKGHSERVASISLLIADKLGLSDERKEKLMYGALLHDIGKIAVRGYVLNKNGKLTEEEYKEVKKHPSLGANLVKGITYLRGVSDIIKHHHERCDGKGYPDGLRDGEIPLESRIISVADAFDAMTSDRPYRKAYPLEFAFLEIKRNRETQFDPEIVDIFLSLEPEKIEKVVSSKSYLRMFKKYLS